MPFGKTCGMEFLDGGPGVEPKLTLRRFVEMLVAGEFLPDQPDEQTDISVETTAGPVLPPVDAAETERRLSAQVRDGVSETLLTSEELAVRTGLRTRQSVYDWRRKGRIVGWQNARRGYVFPAEQLDERNRPLAGLDCVAGLFADGYAAWVWLTTPRVSLDGAPPLALLARGEVERVAVAARGDRQGDFA